MTNNKPIVVVSLVVIVIGILTVFFYISKPKQSTPSTPETKTEPIVTISTDKNGYNRDEVINITVKNGLDKSILHGSVDKFWGIEYFKEDRWINPMYEVGGGFQLTENNLGSACLIVMYERSQPVELKQNSVLSHQWNQKICRFGTDGPAVPKIVKYVENGTYRLVFNYGFEISKDDPYELSDITTVYSNTFTIE